MVVVGFGGGRDPAVFGFADWEPRQHQSQHGPLDWNAAADPVVTRWKCVAARSATQQQQAAAAGAESMVQSFTHLGKKGPETNVMPWYPSRRWQVSPLFASSLQLLESKRQTQRPAGRVWTLTWDQVY